MTKPLVSFAIPVLNEEGNIHRLYKRLSQLANEMSTKCDFEFIFSDNNSSDNTWPYIRELAEKDSRVRGIRFSKNIGFQRSILRNFQEAKGDLVLQIDADLQDPPELLREFFKLWQQGYKIVYGIRESRQESHLLQQFRKFGYWLIDKLSEHPIPRDAGDFRLLDRQVVEILLQNKTPNPYLRGILAGMGFNQVGVKYAREKRQQGESKFGILNIIRLGLSAVLNQSTIPLRASSIFGLIILVFSLIGSLYYLFLKITDPSTPQGLASIHILVLFGIGLNAVTLGLIGECILRIYLILRNEQMAIIQDSINVE